MNDDQKSWCPLCGQRAERKTPGDYDTVECRCCGNFSISRSLLTLLDVSNINQNDIDLMPYLSAHTRQTSERGTPVDLNTNNWRDFAQIHRSTSASQKVKKLLELVASRSGSYGKKMDIVPQLDYPLVDVDSRDALLNLLLDDEQNRRYLKCDANNDYVTCWLTSAGWDYLKQLQTDASTVQRDNRIVETREFSCINDPDLRRVLERDYAEIQRAFNAQCWKSVIILSGGAIEAVLLNFLLQHQSSAQVAAKAPKGKRAISTWNLVDLINVSVELRLITNGVEKLSHSVREYRNLVHPGSEIRDHLVFGAEEAKIALEILHIVHRNCS